VRFHSSYQLSKSPDLMRPAVTRTSPKSLAPWDAAPNARRASYQNWALSGNTGGLLSDRTSACSTFEDCAPAFEAAAVTVDEVSAPINSFRSIDHTPRICLMQLFLRYYGFM